MPEMTQTQMPMSTKPPKRSDIFGDFARRKRSISSKFLDTNELKKITDILQDTRRRSVKPRQYSAGKRITRKKRELQPYEVTEMPIKDDPPIQLQGTLPFPDWFTYWLAKDFYKTGTSLLLEDTLPERAIIIQSPSRYIMARPAFDQYHLFHRGAIQIQLMLDDNILPLSTLAKCYHGIVVGTSNSENVDKRETKSLECLRYNIHVLDYPKEYDITQHSKCKEPKKEETTTSATTTSTTTTTTSTTPTPTTTTTSATTTSTTPTTT